MGYWKKLFAVAALFVSADIRAGQQAHGEWCNSPPIPISNDWVQISSFRIAAVRETQFNAARARLTDQSVIPISAEEAAQLAIPTTLSGPNFFLVRGGLLLPAASTHELIAWFDAPLFVQVHWSGRLQALSIQTLTSIAGVPIAFDVPLLLQVSVRPLRTYVGCTSTE